MATKRPNYTWENGFQQPAKTDVNSSSVKGNTRAEDEDPDAYVAPPSTELVTSTAHNDLGVNVIRSWPTLYDGTNNPHGIPSWWKPEEEVDVLISGGKIKQHLIQACKDGVKLIDFEAGPSGLGLAVSLARQGVSFRIIGKYSGLQVLANM